MRKYDKQYADSRELSILKSNNTFEHLERVNQQIENIDRKELSAEAAGLITELRKQLTAAIITASKVEELM